MLKDESFIIMFVGVTFLHSLLEAATVVTSRYIASTADLSAKHSIRFKVLSGLLPTAC